MSERPAARGDVPTALRFRIARWCGWAPGVNVESDWRGWLAGKRGGEAMPEVGFVPRLLRRRLGLFGRMAMNTAWRCGEGIDGGADFVFGSRHGALARTKDLLLQLARDEPLSPAGFSLSVHNAVAGLFSVVRHDHHPATAMSAGADTLALTLVEAVAMVVAGSPRVLMTYVEDKPPELYAPLLPTPAVHPFALSLLLVPAEGASVELGATTAARAPERSSEEAIVRFLIGDAPQAVIGVDQRWRLSRVA